jgi:ADP-L-glycero-D-manno-heptose 6-epimerase
MIWRQASTQTIPLIYASSAATYGDGALGYDDDESLLPQLRPLNPYGESKHEFDLWALDQERQGVHPPFWSGLKFFNVYGFGERHKEAMASVVLQAFDQITTTGRMRLFRSHRADVADGHQSRDFILVDDIVDVLLGLADRPIDRGIFNLGTGRARTFLDLARAVFAALGVQEQIDFVDTPLSIRHQYQYFTEARMERLAAAGHGRAFTSLEVGVDRYVGALAHAERIRQEEEIL